MVGLGIYSLTIVSGGLHGESPEDISVSSWGTSAGLSSCSSVGVVGESGELLSQ